MSFNIQKIFNLVNVYLKYIKTKKYTENKIRIKV